jgi:amino acid transporter
MTLAPITFLVLWTIFSLMGIIAVYKNKKHNGKERFMFAIVFLIIPILAALLYILVTYSTRIFFWSNSATKDQMWLAESDIGHDVSGSHSGSSGSE